MKQANRFLEEAGKFQVSTRHFTPYFSWESFQINQIKYLFHQIIINCLIIIIMIKIEIILFIFILIQVFNSLNSRFLIIIIHLRIPFTPVFLFITFKSIQYNPNLRNYFISTAKANFAFIIIIHLLCQFVNFIYLTLQPCLHSRFIICLLTSLIIHFLYLIALFFIK